MIRQNILFDPNDPLARTRRNFLIIIGFGLMVSGTAWVLANAFIGSLTLEVQEVITGIILVGSAMLSIYLARTGHIRTGAVIAILPLIVFMLYFELPYIELIGAILAVIAAAVLLNNVLFGAVMLLTFVNFAANLITVVNTFGFNYQEAGERAVVHLIVVITVGGAVRYFVSTVERTARSSGRTTELLQATAEVGQITSKLLSLDELFNRAVELIQDRFAFYHVQVFLVDDNREWANLVSSTGEVGQKLLAKGHRLRVGSQSVIGRVTQVGEPVISRDTDTDRVHAMNELLPNTRSEMALPIVDNEEIIGALDVQSTRRDAFNTTDIQALQVMANQLAIAIRNARLFEAQEKALQENKRLFLEGEAERREIQRLNSQLTREAWEEYLHDRRAITGVAAYDDQIVEQQQWSKVMIEASHKQRPVSRDDNGERVTAVPIVLRNQVIGVIEVRGTPLPESERHDTMVNVAQRLATTLDNIRLFDEAQYTSAQEQRINQIVNHYQTAESIEELLKITLDELTQTLDAQQSMIRLGVSQGESHTASSNGSSSHA